MHQGPDKRKRETKESKIRKWKYNLFTYEELVLRVYTVMSTSKVLIPPFSLPLPLPHPHPLPSAHLCPPVYLQCLTPHYLLSLHPALQTLLSIAPPLIRLQSSGATKHLKQSCVIHGGEAAVSSRPSSSLASPPSPGAQWASLPFGSGV